MRGVRVVIFGATGMVGQGVLRECLLADDVEAVLVVGRQPTGVRHPKLREVVHTDFTDFSALAGEFAGLDACFWCLGVSSAGRGEAEYSHVTYDYTVAAARTLAEVNPDLVFVYVSGAGTDSTERGRVMWARVKGRTENAVLALFRNGYAFRPGFIAPRYGARSKTTWYRVAYAASAPLVPLLRRLAPGAVTTTDQVGRAMLRAARTGYPKRVLGSRDLSAVQP
jgi:uncharacterized protein YbjT (DUF2867 family)